jgi:glycosyltransferase involved in cell wall biosynthesis
MGLSVCLVATELFAWGRFGGFGQCTRTLGTALAERGVNVTVVVPRGERQAVVEELDGMTVYGFPLYEYPFTGPLYKRCDADIYHSEGLSWGSEIAVKTLPNRMHIITCQNPKSPEDWSLVNRYYPIRRRAYNLLYRRRLVDTVKRADAVYCQARHIIPKVKELYGLTAEPGFLPNPVRLPQRKYQKTAEPTVCFLGRFDGEKRPEMFFELAKRFPDVRFVALGRAHDEARDRRLRQLYSGTPNLELPGFVTGQEKERALGSSWILVNTSVSECLPVSFLEAAAHGCAILSFHDPDGFASNFGYYVTDGDLDEGLRCLLEDDIWEERGERGFAYVSEVHELDRVVDLHLATYEALLSGVR